MSGCCLQLPLATQLMQGVAPQWLLGEKVGFLLGPSSWPSFVSMSSSALLKSTHSPPWSPTQGARVLV